MTPEKAEIDQFNEEHQPHGPIAYWDNLGEGWRIDCLCGWTSDIDTQLEYPAVDFDDHMDEIRAQKRR